ncbi:CAP domain-containing protein [Novosphingobium sp. 9U]|uniref:CAP domain-containing protein n=1 Tax=Novosphingobium sp. 9U TaxID=2653158 RepID=UPI0012F1077C|nr:CAP domain-containing protein [Novosphingobium sp. 9U]VWX52936.1 SCP-like extracellular [Novosphingobium sp. 9U]
MAEFGIMSRGWRRKVLGLALLASAPALLGATDFTGRFEQRVLAAHNRERLALGIEPLQWDPALASSARAWAAHLSASGAFQHAPERATDPQGENLWAGTRGYYGLEAMVDGWVREKRYYRPGTFPNNSTTGRVEDVGHYTQLVWRQTRRVGCALASSAGEDVLVCRYSEAGNYMGERPF